MTAIVLDTETTGLDKEKDRVVEIGIVSFRDGSTLMEQRINPGVSIPSEVTMIHGISDEDVQGCPRFADVAENIKFAIESAEAIIGYHIFYDFDMLSAEVARAGVQVRWPTLVCAKRVWEAHEPKERNLQNAYKRFVDRNGFDKAHSAIADIRATRDVLISQITEFNLQDVPWEKFDPERSLWWGPSSHIIMRDGDLVVNFGKHQGKLVAEVDTGFWKWVSSKDFPDHIQLLSLEMVWADELGLDEKRKKITAWALDYKRRKL